MKMGMNIVMEESKAVEAKKEVVAILQATKDLVDPVSVHTHTHTHHVYTHTHAYTHVGLETQD